MAPVQKRFTISVAGSTSSSGTGSGAYLKRNRLRRVHRDRASPSP